MRLIDADALMEHAMRDKLDSRKLIAHMIDSAPTIETKQVKYFDDDEKVWKIGSVIVNETD